MELNWSTFLLEIVNFLVLVWILKRFFYRPVLDAIARRRNDIEKTLKEAETLHKQAEALQQQYQNRLAVWEQERQRALVELAKEIEEERTSQLAALRVTLNKEREKADVLAKRRSEAERRQAEEMALTQGAELATRLLSLAAGPELERRLLELLVQELTAGSKERWSMLHDLGTNKPARIVVSSAFSLGDQQRRTLEQAIGAALGMSGPFHYEEDRGLMAGLRINVGAWVLGANLQDELKAFANFAHEG